LGLIFCKGRQVTGYRTQDTCKACNRCYVVAYYWNYVVSWPLHENLRRYSSYSLICPLIWLHSKWSVVTDTLLLKALNENKGEISIYETQFSSETMVIVYIYLWFNIFVINATRSQLQQKIKWIILYCKRKFKVPDIGKLVKITIKFCSQEILNLVTIPVVAVTSI